MATGQERRLALMDALRNSWRSFLRKRSVDPIVGSVRFGDLASVTPVSSDFGFSRGTPIDRHYIEQFLSESCSLIRGRVLEIAEDRYSSRLGGGLVEQCDVLHVGGEGASELMIVGDLTNLSEVSDDNYDCCVLTQTLQFIYDMPAAVREVERILKPGGVCLATLNGISARSRFDSERWGEYWRITDQGAERLFAEAFLAENIEVSTFGNVFAATCFLQGLAVEDVPSEKLDSFDARYPVLVGVAAQKA